MGLHVLVYFASEVGVFHDILWNELGEKVQVDHTGVCGELLLVPCERCVHTALQ